MIGAEAAHGTEVTTKAGFNSANSPTLPNVGIPQTPKHHAKVRGVREGLDVAQILKLKPQIPQI
jgi:hypothetical protein